MHKAVSAPARGAPAAIAMLVLAVSAGCDRSVEPAAERSQTELVVMPAADGESPYFRARMIQADTRSRGEHFAELVRQSEKHCAGQSTVMLPSSTLTSTPISDGGRAALDFRCADSTAPNRTTVAAGQLSDDPTPAPSGAVRASAWSRFGGAGQRSELLAYRDLLGGLLRDAYVDRCRNGAMVVERVATEVESTTGGAGELPHDKRLQVTLDYRCLKMDKVAEIVAT